MSIDNGKYGILAYIVTLFFFAAMEALAKYLSESISVIQIVWARYAVQFIIVILVISILELFGYKTGIEKPKLLKVQLLRSLSLVLMTYCFFASLSKLPLVEATIISFTFLKFACINLTCFLNSFKFSLAIFNAFSS